MTTEDDPELGADPRRNNDFTYAADPDGRDVPLGSHMRRMNPRDTKLAILTDVNVHRIIRRSTTYGAPYDPDAISPRDDETPEFDVTTGAVVSGPATRPLSVYEVQVAGGSIRVRA
jgi:deferrochelatase/peroxidase EfeB